MYFKNMPNIVYPLGDVEDQVVIKDIFRRVASRNKLLNNLELEKYTIQDGDTPENIAYRYYGNTQYFWVILLVNDIIDPREDWPKTSVELTDYTTNKYGATELNDIHHYDDTDGFHVDYDSVKYANGEQVAVTNLAYEAEINDRKRNIVLLRDSRLMSFVESYNRLINI